MPRLKYDSFMPQNMRFHQLLAMSLLAAWKDHHTIWG